MAGLLPQTIKNRIEPRILELLGDDRRAQPDVAGRETEPLEVAVMTSRDNAWPSRTDRARELLVTIEIDELEKIVRCDARVPEEIDHRADKLLVGVARDSFALARRKPVAKSRGEIAQGNASPRDIESRRNRPGDPPKLNDD